MSVVGYAGLTDLGRVRRENEDRWFADPQQGLFLVADGIGGSFAGGLAAKVVVEVLPALLKRKLNGVNKFDGEGALPRILEALADLSNRLRNESKSQPGASGMGSTVVLIVVHGRSAVVAHMGDSRAYRFREGRLEQLTKDHSLVQLLLDCGEIQAEDAATHPAKGHLTRFVGMPQQALPEGRLLDLRPGDHLLLCSDGLTGMLDDQEIVAILAQQASAGELCRLLVAAANEAGGKDNITAVILVIPKSTSEE